MRRLTLVILIFATIVASLSAITIADDMRVQHINTNYTNRSNWEDNYGMNGYIIMSSDSLSRSPAVITKNIYANDDRGEIITGVNPYNGNAELIKFVPTNTQSINTAIVSDFGFISYNWCSLASTISKSLYLPGTTINSNIRAHSNSGTNPQAFAFNLTEDSDMYVTLYSQFYYWKLDHSNYTFNIYDSWYLGNTTSSYLNKTPICSYSFDSPDNLGKYFTFKFSSAGSYTIVLTNDDGAVNPDFQGIFFDSEFWGDIVGTPVSSNVYAVQNTDETFYIDYAYTNAGPLINTPVEIELVPKGVFPNLDIIKLQSITDINGRAAFTANIDNYGYYDINLLYLDQSSPSTLIISGVNDYYTPHIFTVSDAIGSGDVMNVTGENLFVEGIESFVRPYGSSDAGTVCNVLQGDEFYNVLNISFPNSTPGVYELWVKTAFGLSNVEIINAPRILFLSDNESFEGLSIGASGRNLSSAEYDGIEKTKLRFVNALSNEIAYTITDVEGEFYKDFNPFYIEFIVPSIELLPANTYYVEVSAGADYWTRCTEQTLTIISPAASNPLNLNASWVGEIKWNTIFNVTDYGAVSGDEISDTSSFQNAINAARTAGGGMVYVPNGSYLISCIYLYSDIVLVGESTENTILYYRDDTNKTNVMIRKSGSDIQNRCGVAKFSIRNYYPEFCPDGYVNLGGSANYAMDIRDGIGEKIFCVNLDIVSTYKISYSNKRGIALILSGYEKFICENNVFRGSHGMLMRAYITQYASIKNNVYDYCQDAPGCTANYLFEMNNVVINHPEFIGLDGYYSGQVHGLFLRGLAYVADNYVYNSYSTVTNDGEAYCAEPISGSLSYGDILETAYRSVKVNINEAVAETIYEEDGETVMSLTYYFENRKILFGKVAVIITNGRGIGQYNLVDFENIVFDKVAMTATIPLINDWEVEPDETSQYSLQCMVFGNTFYNNYNNGSTKGILLYGDFFDAVVADNTLLRSDGIGVFGVQSDGTARLNTNYFIRIVRNVIDGMGTRTNNASIGIQTATFGTYSNLSITQAFAFDIRDNLILSDKSSNYDDRPSEMPAIPGIFANVDAYMSRHVGATNTIIRNIVIINNTIVNSKYGISLTRFTSGVFISDNKVSNVDEEFRYLLPTSAHNNAFVATDNTQFSGEYVNNVCYNESTIIDYEYDSNSYNPIVISPNIYSGPYEIESQITNCIIILAKVNTSGLWAEYDVLSYGITLGGSYLEKERIGDLITNYYGGKEFSSDISGGKGMNSECQFGIAIFNIPYNVKFVIGSYVEMVHTVTGETIKFVTNKIVYNYTS